MAEPERIRCNFNLAKRICYITRLPSRKEIDKGSNKNVNSTNWRLFNQQDRMKHAANNCHLTDIKFEVGPNATVFHAHKLTLALASPVFEAMFYGQLAEKGEKVVIPDLMAQGFEHLMRYIYTDKVSFVDITQAFQTWFAAEKYCVPCLKMECNLFFEKCELNADNIWDVLENSILADIYLLKKRCLDFVAREPCAAVASTTFLEIVPQTLEAFLSLEYLDFSELALLQSVVAWGQNQLKMKGGDLTLRAVLQPFLKNIRLGVLTPKEFCKFIHATKGLFGDRESLAILMYLTDPKVFPSPDWLCKKTWQRVRNTSLKEQCKAVRPAVSSDRVGKTIKKRKL